jgi:hypothetical protein
MTDCTGAQARGPLSASSQGGVDSQGLHSGWVDGRIGVFFCDEAEKVAPLQLRQQPCFTCAATTQIGSYLWLPLQVPIVLRQIRPMVCYWFQGCTTAIAGIAWILPSQSMWGQPGARSHHSLRDRQPGPDSLAPRRKSFATIAHANCDMINAPARMRNQCIPATCEGVWTSLTVRLAIPSQRRSTLSMGGFRRQAGQLCAHLSVNAARRQRPRRQPRRDSLGEAGTDAVGRACRGGCHRCPRFTHKVPQPAECLRLACTHRSRHAFQQVTLPYIEAMHPGTLWACSG